MGRWWWWHTVSTTHIPQLILVGFPLISSRRKTKRKNLFFLLCLATPRESERARISSHSLSPLSHPLSLSLPPSPSFVCARERVYLHINDHCCRYKFIDRSHLIKKLKPKHIFVADAAVVVSETKQKKRFRRKVVEKNFPKFHSFPEQQPKLEKVCFFPQKKFPKF